MRYYLCVIQLIAAVGVVVAVPVLDERSPAPSYDGFSCLVDLATNCCTKVLPTLGVAGAYTFNVALGCSPALGANGKPSSPGYGRCSKAKGMPVCAAGPATGGGLPAGATQGFLPKAVHLAPPRGGSSIATVPAGSFDCITALAPKCCDTVMTTSVGVDSAGVNTGCVAAKKIGELSTCKGLGNKLGICCDAAVNAAGNYLACQFSALLPKGK